MAGASVSSRNEKISVKQRNNPSDRASSAIADFEYSDITASENGNCGCRHSDPQSSQIVSTNDLISAVGFAWDKARRPLSALLSKTNSKCKTEAIQGGGTVHYSADVETFHESTSAEDQPFSHCLNSKAIFLQQVQESLEHLKVNQKTSYPRPGYKHFSFWSRVLDRSTVIDESTVKNCLLYAGRPPNLEGISNWMSQISPVEQKNQLDSTEVKNRSTDNCCTSNCSTSADGVCVPSITTSKLNNLAMDVCGPSITTRNLNNLAMEVSGSNPEAAKVLDILFGTPASFDLKPSTTTCSDNDIVHGQCTEVTDCNIVSSSSDVDFQVTKLVSLVQDSENSPKESCNNLHEYQKNKEILFFKAESSDVKGSLLAKEKHKYALEKQEHAFAGAMAGVFVSLCLHPVDTIKTVIQSCHADRKPLHIIGSSIIAERGWSGLYRGISSNIVSSAPISAVYTYTYESVKKSLLPLLPVEYHSLAHCIAGGCASIATSFIFTPRECIKQQMQVGSHYRNCWNAFVQIVRKGGLMSLYAGWGAVLCRNIPHSVIKFYTYESLKQIIVPSVQSNAEANVLVTLVCGGLAGSMASLFTTPFDVVKTRLQTQIPGSMTEYNGVLNTLMEIGKREGLKGLYRGLTPRLVMYMIQGALFFASYESFKRLFSLEVPHLSVQTLHEQKNLHRRNSGEGEGFEFVEQ